MPAGISEEALQPFVSLYLIKSCDVVTTELEDEAELAGTAVTVISVWRWRRGDRYLNI